MGKQENRGTRRTKLRMETAMIELLKEKSIEKITVRELIERADVSRYTFYNYYYDVYDLLDSIGNEIIEEIVSECRKLIGKPYQEGQHPIITAMMKIVLAHEDAIQILGGPNGSREFSVRLRRELIQTACEIYQQRERLYGISVVCGRGNLLLLSGRAWKIFWRSHRCHRRPFLLKHNNIACFVW